MKNPHWMAVALLGLLLGPCGPDESQRPPDAPMMQPGNPASEGSDAPVAPEGGAGNGT